ncbi:aspartate/glutamate racemase family protein [Rhizobium sp. CG5]|uniref:maleate cis-trans isomerase family protein n=1 Tax=Rhizobium sp. CG5 TaxID=2726076 RepID=UPI0020333061|nr:aspartate/glutamate racemase family protein [Rhizobium sp. CG5]
MSGAARQMRIGMLTPSSNTVVEPYTSALLAPLFPDVTAHFSRFTVTRIALDQQANAQFSLEPILAAARLLADARVDVIAWNGTSAAWLGIDKDETLCARLAEECAAVATSAVISLMKILKTRDTRRIGLVTPYTPDVQSRVIDNFKDLGIEVIAERHAGLSDNFSFAEMEEDTIADLCRAVSKAGPKAIVILCTNMRGPMIAASLEQELGIPIYDSVAFTLWGCLDVTGIDMTPLADFGSLFSSA